VVATDPLHIASIFKQTDVTIRQVEAYNDVLPPSNVMSPSPSVQSTLLHNMLTPLRDISTPLCNVSLINLQTPHNDLFLPDSNYSDPIYMVLLSLIAESHLLTHQVST
jgi:hypothetical protein